MSKIITKGNVWDYFNKLSLWEAQCKFCGKDGFIYILNPKRYMDHLHTHEGIIEYEKEGQKGDEARQKWPWIYFKFDSYDDDNKCISKCLVCNEHVKSEIKNLADHLRVKPDCKKKEDHDHVGYKKFIWKYCKELDHFLIECNICSEKYILPTFNLLINGHISKEHLEHFRMAQEKRCITFTPPKDGPLKATVRLYNDIELLRQFYTKLPHFKAKCKFDRCKSNAAVDYIRREYIIPEMQQHIYSSHRKISEWEEKLEKEREKYPWIYFRHFYDEDILYAECLLCGWFYECDSVGNALLLHLGLWHSEKTPKMIDKDEFAVKWIFKYCRENDKGNQILKCAICFEKISSTCLSYIQNSISTHINDEHLDSIDQQQVTKEKRPQLFPNYTDVESSREFQAKCIFCNAKVSYADTTKYKQHVKDRHPKVIKYQDECADFAFYIFLKYIDEDQYQCSLCDEFFNCETPTIRKNMKIHIKRHLQSQSRLPFDWTWKYYKKKEGKDLEVQCSISSCTMQIRLDILPNLFTELKAHTECYHPIKEIPEQRTQDTAGPSGN